ncbi:response regulator transcription factor [Candidatus Gracilibacteria bacterium]|nr:response regulator transcription factor [Candidatus Gracilibacteria bacterium]
MTPFSALPPVRVALFTAADLHDAVVALLQRSPAVLTQQVTTLAAAQALTPADADVLVVGCSVDLIADFITILRLSPDQVAVPVLVIYAEGHRGRLVAACQAGIRGHMLLHEGHDYLALALQGVRHGALVVSPQLWRHFSTQHLDCSIDLTERDRQLLTLVAAGETNHDIAAALHCSVRGVEERLSGLYQRCGVTNRAELAAWWAQRMIDFPPD